MELNESLAEAHASLGFIRLLYDWDPSSTEKEFQRAIQLNPSYPTAHHWYAYDLMALGRPQESLKEIHAASELDPLSAIVNADWGQLLMFAPKDPEAAAQPRKAADLNPDFAQTYWYEGLLYVHDQNYNQAFSAFLDDARLSGIELSQIDAFRDAYRSAGIDGYWKQQLIFLNARSGAHHASAYTLAVIYAEMDKRNESLANLERAYQNHYPSLVFLAE